MEDASRRRRSWANLIFAFTLFSLVVFFNRQEVSRSSAEEQRSQGHVDASHLLNSIHDGGESNGGKKPAPSNDNDTAQSNDNDATDDYDGDGDGDGSGMLHPQCYWENPTDLKNRPVLLFKYSRTGSTWLAWTGKMLELESRKRMLWNWEVQDCNHRGFDSDGLTKYLVEYYTRDQNGQFIDLKNAARDYMKLRCLQTVNPEEKDDGGPLIATINPHETHEKSPPLDAEHWKSIFEAVPNLAVGVLVRTNSVKRAISFIASEIQKKECGSKKLKGGEDCIKKLPKQLHLNTTQLWKSIRDSELKRVVIPQFAANLSKQYGDGKIFCLTYEEMEKDLPVAMEAFGKYIGAEIDQGSLEKLKEESSSYKRGSNDLSEYIENYNEVRESLSSNSCILNQLESTEPTVFSSCNVS